MASGKPGLRTIVSWCKSTYRRTSFGSTHRAGRMPISRSHFVPRSALSGGRMIYRKLRLTTENN